MAAHCDRRSGRSECLLGQNLKRGWCACIMPYVCVDSRQPKAGVHGILETEGSYPEGQNHNMSYETAAYEERRRPTQPILMDLKEILHAVRKFQL
jgi:hypothetical protein